MPDTDGTEFGSSQDSLWSTPQARDFRSGDDPNGIRATRKREQGWSQNLNDQVKMWPTPTSRDHKDGTAQSCANVEENGLLGRVVHSVLGPPNPTGSLNPQFVEWLMGYPIGHTACAGWETRFARKSAKKSCEQ